MMPVLTHTITTQPHVDADAGIEMLTYLEQRRRVRSCAHTDVKHGEAYTLLGRTLSMFGLQLVGAA